MGGRQRLPGHGNAARDRGATGLPVERVGQAAVLEQLGLVEPQAHFVLRFLLLPEACTRLATALPVVVATALDWCAKSPRIVPG